MFLLVTDRVPPDVEQTVRPDATVDEEGAKIESSAILRYDKIDRAGTAVAVG